MLRRGFKASTFLSVVRVGIGQPIQKGRKRSGQTGFSLVEVMVALLLTGFLSAAMFKVYINQHHTWMIEDSVIEMQQNARVAIDVLTSQIRMAGYGVPNGVIPIVAHNTNPDTIEIIYNSDACDAPLTHPMPQPSAELRCDGYDVSCFYDGEVAYIYDPNTETGEFFTITQVQTGSSHIQHNLASLSKAYPSGSMILSLIKMKYYIDYSDSTNPRMMVIINNGAPQVFAEQITDLQFQYSMKDGSVADQPSDAKNIRLVKMRVSARTAKKDIELTSRPYLFRNYMAEVFLRNVGA